MTFIEGSVEQPVALQALRQAGKNARVKGFVHNIRDMGEFSFLILRTGGYMLQCVYNPAYSKTTLEGLREGACIELWGEAVDEPRAQNGFEVHIDGFTVISSPAAEYPFAINKKYLNLNIDTNLDYRPLTLRNPRQRAIFKVQEAVADGFADFMRQNGFTQVHTPKIVSAGAEGGANIFKLDYFDTKAYLNQSPQFYKQMMVGVFDRVFEIAPVFRAEKHHTSRHLNEYVGLDFEMGFISGMEDVMAVETAMLTHLFAYVAEHCPEELAMWKVQIPVIDKIPTVTFMQAREIIEKLGRKPGKWDLEPDDEVALCDYAKKEFGSDFVFITHFPAAKRPFYAKDDPTDERFALSFDLLFRGLEITTGGQRIHDYNEQIAKMRRMGLDPEDFSSYLMIHKYGMPPHGGLGIGLERLVMKLMELKNVREASLFPRDTGRLLP
ncbi:aspartate--tRNA(Asn) ligase [Ethanoligenens sp.]|uniref:aspartate--tRNA(Asn) ligase n=1 Tax=Ethanoligenens sp. TaxID=2099655 RepID=UPI0039EC8530